jgi:cellulose synthase/poly-beta-1,6-N-acetylglucosamine synthase-like glycosyltransferase
MIGTGIPREDQPQVAVVIPTIQRPTLEATIDAIHGQSTVPSAVEIIVNATPKMIAEKAETLTADFLAIADDDAIIPNSWLESALSYLSDPTVAYVCGSLDPRSKENSKTQDKIAKVQCSFFGSFIMKDRYKPAEFHGEDRGEIIHGMGVYRRSAFLEAMRAQGDIPWAGWETRIAKYLRAKGWKIVYAKELTAIHPPRDNVRKFVRQKLKEGSGRAAYFRSYPSELLSKPYFLIPSIFVVSLFFYPYDILFILAYTAIVAIWYGITLLPYFLVNHLAYGVGFFYGLSGRVVGEPRLLHGQAAVQTAAKV